MPGGYDIRWTETGRFVNCPLKSTNVSPENFDAWTNKYHLKINGWKSPYENVSLLQFEGHSHPSTFASQQYSIPKPQERRWPRLRAFWEYIWLVAMNGIPSVVSWMSKKMKNPWVKHVWCFCWGRGEMDGWSLRKMVIIYKYDGVEWLMFGPHKLICLRIFVGDFGEFLVNWYHVDVFVGVEEGGKKVGLLEPCGFLEVLLDVCSNWECFTRKSCQHEACFRGQFGDTPWN